MPTPTQLMVAVGGLNVLVGLVFTALLYAMLERAPSLAGAFGVFTAAGVVVAQARLGEMLLSVSVAEMKLLVIVGVLGAALGITMFTTSIAPDNHTHPTR